MNDRRKCLAVTTGIISRRTGEFSRVSLLVYTALCAPRLTLEPPRHPRKRAKAKEAAGLYVTASNSAFGTRGLEASLVLGYICTGCRGFCVSVSQVTYAAPTWQCGRSRPIDDAPRCVGPRARVSRAPGFNEPYELPQTLLPLIEKSLRSACPVL